MTRVGYIRPLRLAGTKVRVGYIRPLRLARVGGKT